ncbi:MAG TPA: AsmA-like C-terminal region-containing protein [Candidatus Acidoferrum sp.]|nr:AsmA-like C-terminal region-containing protein [Candidatus Acidoferrum sp.]
MRKLVCWWVVVPVLGVCCVLVWAFVIRNFEPKLQRLAQQRTEQYFQTHFHSTVEISGLQVSSVLSHVHVTIRGVVLREMGASAQAPMMELQQVTFDARTLSLFSHHPVIGSVSIDGLRIRIAPRPQGSQPLIRPSDGDLADRYPVVIKNLYVKDADLILLPRDPGKSPHEFDLHRLTMGPLGFRRPARFHARLTNPVPTGEIDAAGAFGPWDAQDPGATPVSGHYTFEKANLGTLNGLQGTLSSTGSFDGPLNFLAVNGETDTPNFSLRATNHPVDLRTAFSAIVDGTNGNTILKQVVARFGRSTLNVEGEVVDRTPKRGRTIVLRVATQGATVQDLLSLAIDSSRPMMTGAALLHANIDIGEGNADLMDRMRLSGHFDIAGAQFAAPKTEERIEALSLKAQGKPGEVPAGDPATDFSGSLQMGEGLVRLSQLTFDVTGAAVALEGMYNLDSGQLDLRGKLRMQAKLSQTTTGVKSFFLKAVDPFFEGKGAGTVLPIKITGTKDKPDFALDFHDKTNEEARK